MWSLLTRHVQLLLVVATSLLLAWGLDALYAQATGVHPYPMKWISAVAFLIEIVIVGLLSWRWRWLWKKVPQLNHWIFPDLNGAWEGTLISTWVDPAAPSAAPTSKKAKVEIRQGLFDVHIKLTTDEASSFSTGVFLTAFPPAGRYRVGYSYTTEPKAQVRRRNSKHDGTAHLDWDENQPAVLTGRYFTDRETSGDLKLRRK